MRQKPTTLPIGSVSSGTLRPEDLIPAFLSAAEDLRLTQAERAQVREIRTRYDTTDPEDDDAYWQDEDIDTLTDILNAHCPDYCYFGATEGDGSDFGCWPITDLEREDSVYRLPEGEYPNGSIPADYSHALFVNDHGNCTLYRRAGRRWIEVWAVV